MTQIRTERLLLRPMRESDCADLFAVFSDPDAMRYWSTLPHKDMETTAAMIAETIGADPAKHVEFAIEFEGKVIGKAGLWMLPELGYILHPDYWRRGLGREAAVAVIHHGFEVLGLDRIVADVDPDNAASLIMLSELGFSKTGFEKNTLKIGDKWFDSIYLELRNPAETASDN